MDKISYFCAMGLLTIVVCGIWRGTRSRTRFGASSARRRESMGANAAGLQPAYREGIPMSNFDPNYAAARRGVGADRAIAIDAGLRAYMIRVYNYMAAGVALTGVVAWLTYQMAGGDAIVIAGSRISGLTPLGQLIFNPVTTI